MDVVEIEQNGGEARGFCLRRNEAIASGCALLSRPATASWRTPS